MSNANFEMVEDLVRRANITYTEAKDALEACDWNMTEAVILLEKQGKMNTGRQNGSNNTGSCFDKEKIRQTAENCASEFKDAVHKGNVNYFEMMYNGKIVFSIPVTAAIIIGLIFFHMIIPAAIIAILCGCSFHISKKEDHISTQFTSYQPWNNNGANGSDKINLDK